MLQDDLSPEQEAQLAGWWRQGFAALEHQEACLDECLMTHHHFAPAQITARLVLARSLAAEGHSIVHICRRLQVSELTYLGWEKKYGDLPTSAVGGLRTSSTRTRRCGPRWAGSRGRCRSWLHSLGRSARGLGRRSARQLLEA